MINHPDHTSDYNTNKQIKRKIKYHHIKTSFLAIKN